MIKIFLPALLLLGFAQPVGADLQSVAPASMLRAIDSCAKTANTELSPVNNYAVVGATRYKGYLYYLLAIRDPQQPEFPWEMVIRFSGTKECAVPWVNPAGDFISMLQSPVLPAGVAHELASQRVDYRLKHQFKGSKQAMFQSILSHASDNQLWMTPEEYAALKKLGFAPGNTIQIIFPPVKR